MGGLNTCFTIGVAFGALIAGALEPLVGWVSQIQPLPTEFASKTNNMQRAVFWLQTPLALAGGLGVFFALPQISLTKHNPEKHSLGKQLRSIDYLGSVTLVRLNTLTDHTTQR